jgi:hypothetical protein
MSEVEEGAGDSPLYPHTSVEEVEVVGADNLLGLHTWEAVEAGEAHSPHPCR